MVGVDNWDGDGARTEALRFLCAGGVFRGGSQRSAGVSRSDVFRKTVLHAFSIYVSMHDQICGTTIARASTED